MNEKILHLITGLDIGGAEEMLLQMVPKLNEQGLENRVMCIKGRGLVGKELKAKGVGVEYLDFNHIGDGPKSFRTFLKSLKKWKPDVLVTHLVHADILGRVWGSFIAGIPKSIVYRHGPYLQWEWWSKVDLWTESQVARYCVVSRWLEKELLKKGFPKHKIQFSPNAVDIDHFQKVPPEVRKEYRTSLGIEEGTVVFGTISTLKPGKGYEELIEAVSRLKEKKSVKFLILGEGPEKRMLEEKVNKMGLGETVKFLGLRRDVEEWLSAMDVFVLPTHFEGMSVALLQAMAAGKAIITTDIEANRDVVIHEESALLVPVKNPEALAQAIKQLIENPDKRDQLGKKARERCQQIFSLEKSVEKFASILKTI